MTRSQRIEALSFVGKHIESDIFLSDLPTLAARAYNTNNWFTTENVANALNALAKQLLKREKLSEWTAKYAISDSPKPKQVGIVMAGNIPAVGFHDLLSVLVSGHIALVKASSQDVVLIQELIKIIIEIEPLFAPQIRIVERLNAAEAIIATGSDNSARYFEQYFSSKPHIIRKNRTSIGILRGDESPEDYLAVGQDILSYFGLGCRNVSKLYVPQNWTVDAFYEAIEPLGDVFLHHKYKNNYDYNRSIYLVNREVFFDNGFLSLKEDAALVSPISVVFFERYAAENELVEKVNAHASKIQCMVSREAWFANSLPFGTTQSPSLSDYADGVDTLEFLVGLH